VVDSDPLQGGSVRAKAFVDVRRSANLAGEDGKRFDSFRFCMGRDGLRVDLDPLETVLCSLPWTPTSAFVGVVDPSSTSPLWYPS